MEFLSELWLQDKHRNTWTCVNRRHPRFHGHGLALIPHMIWYRGMRLWTVMLDAIIYALLTAGVFGWLWLAIATAPSQ